MSHESRPHSEIVDEALKAMFPYDSLDSAAQLIHPHPNLRVAFLAAVQTYNHLRDLPAPPTNERTT